MRYAITIIAVFSCTRGPEPASGSDPIKKTGRGIVVTNQNSLPSSEAREAKKASDQANTNKNASSTPKLNRTAKRWPSVKNWKSHKPSSPMRAAEYKHAKHDVVLSVFLFDNFGQNPRAVAERWKGEYSNPSEPKDSEYGSLKGTWIEASGTYRSSMPMNAGTKAVENQGLLGFATRVGKTVYLFKVTGQKDMVEQVSDDFRDYLSTFEPRPKLIDGSPPEKSL